MNICRICGAEIPDDWDLCEICRAQEEELARREKAEDLVEDWEDEEDEEDALIGEDLFGEEDW